MQKMNQLTIFTPAYNRAYILPELYNSLIRQTDRRFKWMVIDDGSTDNTKELVERWKKDKEIDITYIYQKNSGKAAAHNRAAALCDTDLFTCVDSDDQLTDDAVAVTLKAARKLKNRIGLVFKKKKHSGEIISRWPDELRISTLKEAYSKYGAAGDTMLVYRTQELKKFEFPSFSGEKFVPEAYLYDKLDQEGKLLFIHKALYICDYLSDGYTRSMSRIIRENPQGYLAFIEQRLYMDESMKERLMDTIRYTAISISSKRREMIRQSVYPILTFLSFPAGILFYIIRYRKNSLFR